MTKIYKYILNPETSLNLPASAKILHVAAQHDDICLWALVDTTLIPIERHFITLPTGATVPDNAQHLGTSLLYDDTLVFHTFELT